MSVLRDRGSRRGDAYDRAVPIMTENALHPDAQEGISAFLQKRSPHWSGTLTNLTAPAAGTIARIRVGFV